MRNLKQSRKIQSKSAFVLLIIISILFALLPSLTFATPPMEPGILRIEVVGEPKLNNPFEIKIKLYAGAGETFKLKILLNQRTKKDEIPSYIKILEGQTDTEVTIPGVPSTGGKVYKSLDEVPHAEYAIRLMVTEVKAVGVFVSVTPYSHLDTEFNIIVLPDKGGILTDEPGGTKTVADWRIKEALFKNKSTEFKDQEKKSKELKDALEKERGKQQVFLGCYPVYITPQGNILTGYTGYTYFKTSDAVELKYISYERYTSLLPEQAYFFSHEKDKDTGSFIANKEFNKVLDLLNPLKNATLPNDESVVFHNNLGIMLIALGNFKEGSKEIKEAVKLFQSHYEEIKEVDEKRFKYIYENEKALAEKPYPYEELKSFVFQNLSVVYTLEGHPKDVVKALEEAKIQRSDLSGTYYYEKIKTEDDDFSKKIQKAQKTKYKIKGK